VKAVFPISYMSVTYAITGLFVALGLLGGSAVAAEIALAHGATLATFHAFSANTRNIILSQSSRIGVSDILLVRLLLILPLGLAAYALAVLGANVSPLVALVIVLRRAIEWIGEVHLSSREVQGDRGFAQRYLFMEAALGVLVVATFVFHSASLAIVLGLWAIVPLFASLRFIVRHVGSVRTIRWQTVRAMLPHFASSWVNGASIYVFRVLAGTFLVLDDAGNLFTAIGVGSFVGTLFANVWGPSLARAERLGQRSASGFFSAVLVVLGGLGLLIFAGATVENDLFSGSSKPLFFWQTLGLSMVGGVVMILAQRIRIRLLESDGGRAVFGPDALSSLLTTAAVPVMYGSLGREGMTPLYLINAVLIYIFYLSADHKTWLPAVAARSRADFAARLGIAVVLFLPMFFQLSGKIFNPPEAVWDSGGVLLKLPLPISAIGCYLGIVVLAQFSRSILSLAFILALFFGMVGASLITTSGELINERTKLILMVQYLLPMFGLVLGQQFAATPAAMPALSRGVLAVLLAVVPLQLALGWVNYEVVLEHSLYFFGVYQHLQYVPVIVSAGYLLVWGALWGDRRYTPVLYVLGALCSMYAVASFSALALALLVAGLAVLAGARAWLARDWKAPVLWICLLATAGGYLYIVRQTPEFGWKYSPTVGSAGAQSSGETGGYPQNRYIDYLAPIARHHLTGSAIDGPSDGPQQRLVSYALGKAPAAHFLEVSGRIDAGSIRVEVRSGAKTEHQDVAGTGPFALRFAIRNGVRYRVNILGLDDRGQRLAAQVHRALWQPLTDWDRFSDRILGEVGQEVAVVKPAAGSPTVQASSAPGGDAASVDIERARAAMTHRAEAQGPILSRLPLNVRERLFDWKLYSGLIASTSTTLLFGHARPLPRDILTSPHNYYLDFVYNFGVLALLPLLFLVIHTLQLVWREWRYIAGSSPVLAVVLVVAFLVLVDSMFKVTLRQPYPGIIAFFLWGLLIESLRTRREATAAPSR